MTRFILNMELQGVKAEVPQFNRALYNSMFLNAEQSKRLLDPNGDKFFKNLPEETKGNLMLIIQGKETYDYLFQLNKQGIIHIGLRNFNYIHITDMDICWIDGVRFAFFRHLPKKGTGLIAEKWQRIVSGKYDAPPIPKPEIRMCNTLAEVQDCFNYFRDAKNKKSLDKLVHDYETYDFPETAWFRNLCVSFCGDTKVAWSINIRGLKEQGDDVYKQWIKMYTEFMLFVEDHLMCYNAEYEPRCTYREIGKFIRTWDLWAYVRSLDMKASLKYFTQYLLAQPSWDDESEYTQDALGKLFARFPKKSDWDEYEGWIKECRTKEDVIALAKKEWYEKNAGWTDEAILHYYKDHPNATEEETKKAIEYDTNWTHQQVQKAIDNKVESWVDWDNPNFYLTEEFWGNTWASVKPECMMTYNALDSFYTLLDYLELKKQYGDKFDKAARVISNHKMLSAIFQMNGIVCDEAERAKLQKDYEFLRGSCKLALAGGYWRILKEGYEAKFPNWKDWKLSKTFWWMFDNQCNVIRCYMSDRWEGAVRNLGKYIIGAGYDSETRQFSASHYEEGIQSVEVPDEVKAKWNDIIKSANILKDDGTCPWNWINKNEIADPIGQSIVEVIQPDLDKIKAMCYNIDTAEYTKELEKHMWWVIEEVFGLRVTDKTKYNFNFFIQKLETDEKTRSAADWAICDKFDYYHDYELGNDFAHDVLVRVMEYKNGQRHITWEQAVFSNLLASDLGPYENFIPLRNRDYITFLGYSKLINADEALTKYIEPVKDVKCIDLKPELLPDLGISTPDELSALSDSMGNVNSGDVKHALFSHMVTNMAPFISTFYQHYYNYGEELEQYIDEMSTCMDHWDEWYKDKQPKYQADWCLYPWFGAYDSMIQLFRDAFPKLKDTGLHDLKVGSCITGDNFELVYYMSLAYCFMNTLTKEISTYVAGQNISSSSTFEYDEHCNSAWTWDLREYYDRVMIKPQWKVCLVETKRWSSGFHTFPPTCDVMHSWIPESPDRLFFYFDCSQAEVKTCAYSSKDPTLLKWYSEGKDIYVEMGKIIYGDKFIREVHRKILKSVVLGLLYGRGIESIALGCEITKEEAESAVHHFRQLFPTMYEFIQKKVDYAKEYEEIDTLLGDKIYLRYEDNPTTCGINYFVQGGTALMLGNGFYNCAYTALVDELGVLSKGMIHDAYFGTLFAKHIVMMYFYFKKQFTKFIEDEYHIQYLYDFEIGTNFRDKIHFDINIEKATISLSGESIYVKKCADILIANNPWITDATEYFPNWQDPACNKDAYIANLREQVNPATGEKYTKDEAKKIWKDDPRFCLGKPKDTLSGYYSRRNHHFCHENNYMMYPDDKNMTLKIDEAYLKKCIDAVNAGNYSEFRQELHPTQEMINSTYATKERAEIVA